MAKQMKSNHVIKKNMQENLISVQATNEKLKTENDEMKKDLTAILGKHQALESELKSGLEAKQEMAAKAKNAEDELSSLKDKFRVKTVMLNDQNETIGQLKEDKNELKRTIDAYIAKEKELKEKSNELMTEMDDLKDNYMILQNKLDKYNESEYKQAMEEYKEESEKYYKLYSDEKKKLKEKEEIVHYVTNEVQQMKKMWDREKKVVKDTFDAEMEEKAHIINDMQIEMTSNQQQVQVLENKLKSETGCRQKWEKKCAQVNAKKVETEQEMRLILTEMERYKKTAAHFAKAFNV